MRDPGLQAERTALAWQRTGISGALIGGVAVLASAHRGSVGLFVVSAVVAGVAAALSMYATAYRAPAEPVARLASPWPRLVATAAIPVLLGVLGVVLAVT